MVTKCDFDFLLLVPTPPRNLEVEFSQEDPPQVKVSWQRPREVFGSLRGFKVTWGRLGERYEEHILRPDTYVFLSSYLGKCLFLIFLDLNLVYLN